MKKIFFITILLLVGLCKINALDQHNITCERAWEIVLSEVLKNNTENVNVFVSQSVIFSSSQIKTMYRDEQSPDFDSWFFFIDDKPFASWAHPCRYVYVNIKDGTYVIVDKQQPPLIQEMKSLVEKKINVQGELFDFNKLKSLKKLRTSASAIHNYAVIISGGGNAWSNWVRYWNDCSAIYSTLINVYGYPKDHIYVLISDGTNPEHDRHHYDGHYDSSPLDLDGDGSNDIQYAATRANITQVFNTLRNRLTPADNLFIYTTDHGGQESGTDVYMNLWNEIIRDDEFASEINKVNAGKINICMEQCHSGGFIDDLQANNRVIATACRFDEPSHAMSNPIYNEFVYHWTAAVAGRTPQGAFVNADSNNDGIVSMREAFLYAQNHDTQDETPQYSSIPAILGQVVSLKAFSLSGPASVCNQATYTIKNLPQGATVQWSSSNNSMTLQSGQGTATALFRQTGFTNAEIRAAVRFNGATIANLAQAITICQPFLSGPSAICNQATYTVENLPAGLQVQWQVHPGLHVYGQTNNSISVSKQSLTSPIEKGWVKATIVGTNITFRNDDILVWKSGITQTNDLLVGQLDASGGQVEAVYPIQELGRNFQWSASNNWQAMIQGYHFTDFSGTPQSGASSVYITVRFDDPCGSETIIYKEFELPSTYSFSLSPNPVTDVTTLQWKLSGEAISMNSNSQITQQPVIWNRSTYEIQLWSGMTMLRSFRTDEPTFQIPMAGLPAGLYFVRVVKDGQTYTQKLIKK